MNTLLVVDDEKMLREAVSSFFEQKGYIVYTAESGREALEVFKAKKPDFIILDLMLPDISGEEVCLYIREKSDVPIIMLTAKSLEEDVINGLQIGADDYIKKPFSLKELYARAEVIRRRAFRKEKTTDKMTWNGGALEADFELRMVKISSLLRLNGKFLARWRITRERPTLVTTCFPLCLTTALTATTV